MMARKTVENVYRPQNHSELTEKSLFHGIFHISRKAVIFTERVTAVKSRKFDDWIDTTIKRQMTTSFVIQSRVYTVKSSVEQWRQ